MKPARVLSVLLVLVVVGALLIGPQSGSAFRGEPGANQALSGADEGFTYQGRLLVGGAAVSGLYDFKFDLYTLASGGTHVAGPLEKLGIQVTNGTFTVLVDFLAANFDGSTRWLEINVRPAGGSVYTPLTPRQELTPAPYADYAFQVPWGGIQGLQAGAGAGLSFNSGQFSVNFGGSGSAVTAARSDHSHYLRTLLISPTGTDSQNGTALLTALGNISDNNATRRYLVLVEPGIYDLGANSLVMKPYVDIQGSGQDATVIKSAGSTTETRGTVQAANNSELSFLQVQNYGGYSGGIQWAVALYATGVDSTARIHHVMAYAFASPTNRAVFINLNGSPLLADLTVLAEGNTYSYGIYISNASSPTIRNSSIEVRNASSTMTGIYIGTNSAPVLEQVSVHVSTGAATGATYGADLDDHCSPTFKNTSLTVQGGSTAYGARLQNSSTVFFKDADLLAYNAATNYGLYIQSSSASGQTSYIHVYGGTTANTGVWIMNGTAPITIEDTIISASGLGILTGVRSETSNLTLNRSTVSVVGGAGNGLMSYTSNITIANSNISAPNVAVNSDDTTNTGGPYETKIDNSTLTSLIGNPSVPAVLAQTNVNLFIGGSHVSDGIQHYGSGTTTCVFTYKSNYTAYNAACQ